MNVPVTLLLDDSEPSSTGFAIDMRGRLRFLASMQAVVQVDYQQREGWLCTVTARRSDMQAARHVILSGEALAAADTALCIDPVDDPDGFATLLWSSAVHRLWRSTAMHALARVLVHDLRPPGCLDIDLDQAVVAQLHRKTRIARSVLRTMINRLDGARLLVCPVNPDEGCWGVHRLAMPDTLILEAEDWPLARPPRELLPPRLKRQAAT